MIMTSESITTAQQQPSTNSDEEIQRRQDTNQTNEKFENDEEMTIKQKRESNKRERPDSNSDRISPLYKTRNIENLNNSTPGNSIFTTPDSSILKLTHLKKHILNVVMNLLSIVLIIH